MNETLILRRRARWNRVLPAILHALQDKVMFWRRVPRTQWDWTTLLLFAILLWGFYRALTGKADFLLGFVLALIVKDLHDNALPIFARVRIKGDDITLGTLFTERESLKNVRHYQLSRENQNAVRFALHKDDFTGCISFVVDEEDRERVIEFLGARKIIDINAYLEQLSLEEMQFSARKTGASMRV